MTINTAYPTAGFLRSISLPHSLLAMIASLSLSACSLAPTYERPNVAVGEAYKEVATGVWKVAEPGGNASANAPWWAGYNDPQLNALIEEARERNQNVQLAAARYRQALALAGGAQAALYPSLGLNVSETRSKRNTATAGQTTALTDTHALSFVPTWEIDLWGRLSNQRDTNQATAEATAGDFHASLLLVLTSVGQNYFQLRVLDAQQKLLDETVIAYERSLSLTKNRYTHGVSNRVDVVQAEAQVKSTQALALENAVQRSQVEHALAVLLGKTPAQFSLPPSPLQYAVDTALNVKLPAPALGIPSSLLERRPDIAAAERRVAAANASIGVAEAARFPSLTLSASVGYQSPSYADWLTAPNRVWSVGAALAGVLFDGGLRRYQADASIAAYDATVATYRQTVLTSFQEVEDNLVALRLLEQEAGILDGAVSLTRESTQLTLNRYKAGTVDYLSVVTVQTAALSAERNALAVLGRRLTASINLVKALGGGWSNTAVVATSN